MSEPPKNIPSETDRVNRVLAAANERGFGVDNVGHLDPDPMIPQTPPPAPLEHFGEVDEPDPVFSDDVMRKMVEESDAAVEAVRAPLRPAIAIEKKAAEARSLRYRFFRLLGRLVWTAVAFYVLINWAPGMPWDDEGPAEATMAVRAAELDNRLRTIDLRFNALDDAFSSLSLTTLEAQLPAGCTTAQLWPAQGEPMAETPTHVCLDGRWRRIEPSAASSWRPLPFTLRSQTTDDPMRP